MEPMERRPLPPFSAWPVQIYDEGLGFVWYAEPAAFVLQACVDHGTVELIEKFNDLIDRVLDVKREAVRDAGGLFIFHDWRSISAYDREARVRQLERMRAREPGYARRTVVAVLPKNRLLRMGVEAVNLFATVTLRSKIELVTEPTDALRRSAIQIPAANARFPLIERQSLRPQ